MTSPPKIKTERTHDLDLIARMDRECFPEDEPVSLRDAAWWVVTWDGEPVAFAGAKFHLPDNAIYLCRAGVLDCARGHGLQSRLILTRLAWGAKNGARGAYTYTVPGGVHSANNLIRAGFRQFAQQYAWAGWGVCYWWRGL